MFFTGYLVSWDVSPQTMAVTEQTWMCCIQWIHIFESYHLTICVYIKLISKTQLLISWALWVSSTAHISRVSVILLMIFVFLCWEKSSLLYSIALCRLHITIRKSNTVFLRMRVCGLVDRCIRSWHSRP